MGGGTNEQAETALRETAERGEVRTSVRCLAGTAEKGIFSWVLGLRGHPWNESKSTAAPRLSKRQGCG